MSKVVYIAHPIGGDVETNIRKILDICHEVHVSSNGNIVPFAPYLVSLQYLKDHLEAERELGIAANHAMFHKRAMDEVWVYGDKISSGMRAELERAVEYNIPIICKNEALFKDVRVIIAETLKYKRKIRKQRNFLFKLLKI